MMRVKNWAEFQHYKDRNPPWIKLHKALLDDRAFQRLPDASRALAPCLWLLASEAKDGIFNGSVEEVAFRIRQTEKWVVAAINPLISGGFVIVVQDASNALANCGQVAVPETETETETEKPLSGKPDVHKQTAIEILNFLNTKTGRHYKPVKVNLGFIIARLKAGATETELRQVVAKKTREWQGNPVMDEYLRPATLFNDLKFNQYVGELLQEGDQNAMS